MEDQKGWHYCGTTSLPLPYLHTRYFHKWLAPFKLSSSRPSQMWPSSACSVTPPSTFNQATQITSAKGQEHDMFPALQGREAEECNSNWQQGDGIRPNKHSKLNITTILFLSAQHCQQMQFVAHFYVQRLSPPISWDMLWMWVVGHGTQTIHLQWVHQKSSHLHLFKGYSDYCGVLAWLWAARSWVDEPRDCMGTSAIMKQVALACSWWFGGLSPPHWYDGASCPYCSRMFPANLWKLYVVVLECVHHTFSVASPRQGCETSSIILNEHCHCLFRLNLSRLPYMM